jgi:hypothetical protein
VTVILGTSAEVGKTTAGLAVLHTLLAGGLANVAVLKATGTASVQETARYADYGARQTFDCIDFGLPTTYPSGREGIAQVFETGLGHILSLEADAILIECGGDLFGANVPVFLECLKHRRPDIRAGRNGARDRLLYWPVHRHADFAGPHRTSLRPAGHEPVGRHG